MAWHVFFRQITTADNDAVWLSVHLFYQLWQVIGKMLAIGIDGHSMCESQCHSLTESCHQGMSLAFVWRIRHHVYPVLHGVQYVCRAVGAAIVDNNDLLAVTADIVYHLLHRSGVVIRRNDDTQSDVGTIHYEFLNCSDMRANCTSPFSILSDVLRWSSSKTILVNRNVNRS